MAQALCRFAARVAGLEALLVLPGGEVRWLGAPGVPRWLERGLRMCGWLRAREALRHADELGLAGRARLAARGTVRAEFAAGAAARFRARVLREAHDFSRLRLRAGGAA